MMKKRFPPDRLVPYTHRAVLLVSYLLIIVVGLRRLNDLVEGLTTALLLSLLGSFLVLFATEPLISARIKAYPRVYFILQMILVLSIGTFREYQDTWALLYIVLGFQVALLCSHREAATWYSLFITTMLVLLSIEFGPVSGLGRGLAYIMIGVLIISYDVQFTQHEQALSESQTLLAELQEAHQKLAEYAAQADKLAAMQQRNAMIQELYDSVGQKIFAIQLAAETSRLMFARDPQRAVEQLDALQAQTQSTLGSMRQLIDQWRPE